MRRALVGGEIVGICLLAFSTLQKEVESALTKQLASPTKSNVERKKVLVALRGVVRPRRGRHAGKGMSVCNSGILRQAALNALQQKTSATAAQLSTSEQLVLKTSETSRGAPIARRSNIDKRKGLLVAMHRSAYVRNKKMLFRESDLEEFFCRGTGPGGQATNRRAQTCLVKHVPSGLIVRCSKFPSLRANRCVARMMLNLKLEHFLMGANSVIGRKKLQMLERKQKKKEDIARFERIAAAVQRKELTHRNYFSFLTDRSVKVSADGISCNDLFGHLCGRWWNLLLKASKEENAHLPQWFQFMFPLEWKETPCLREKEELDKCSGSVAARDAVRTALRCFLEMFSLLLVDGPPPEVEREALNVKLAQRAALLRWHIERDTSNWRELSPRRQVLVNDNDDKTKGSLGVLIGSAFQRVYRSLRRLGMADEAAAMAMFFAMQREREKQKCGAGIPSSSSSFSSQCCNERWGTEVCRLLAPHKKESQ